MLILAVLNPMNAIYRAVKRELGIPLRFCETLKVDKRQKTVIRQDGQIRGNLFYIIPVIVALNLSYMGHRGCAGQWPG
jgi:hypothetical protein